MATSRERGPAEQQGDGQPENLNELRDPTGGSAMAGEEKNASERSDGASASPDSEVDAGEQGRVGRGGSQADGEEEIEVE